MQSQDSIQPDAHAYGAVMACLAKANMVQETLALLGVSAIAFVHDVHHLLLLNRVHGAVRRALCDARALQHAYIYCILV
jgi:hypothetical protein